MRQGVHTADSGNDRAVETAVVSSQCDAVLITLPICSEEGTNPQPTSRRPGLSQFEWPVLTN